MMGDTAIIRTIGGITAEVTIKEQHRDELEIADHPVEKSASITDHAYMNPAILTVQLGSSSLYLSGNKGQSSASPLSDVSNALDQFSSVLSKFIGTNATKALSDAVGSASALASGSSSQAVDAIYSQASAIAGQYGNSMLTAALGAAYSAVKASMGSSGSGDGTALITGLYQQFQDMQKAREPIEVQTGKRLYENMLIKSLSVDTDQETENVLIITMVLRQIFLVETKQTTMPPMANRKTPQSTSGVANTGTKNLGPPTGDVQVVSIGGQTLK